MRLPFIALIYLKSCSALSLFVPFDFVVIRGGGAQVGHKTPPLLDTSGSPVHSQQRKIEEQPCCDRRTLRQWSYGEWFRGCRRHCSGSFHLIPPGTERHQALWPQRRHTELSVVVELCRVGDIVGRGRRELGRWLECRVVDLAQRSERRVCDFARN